MPTTYLALWIWARIKRVGRSRRSLLQEELGYIEGGSNTLVEALVSALERLGVDIRLATAVEEVVITAAAFRPCASTALSMALTM